MISATRILAIESSCDDTSVALLSCTKEHIRVEKESTRSQIDVHKIYGGVVPELAGRAHAEALFPLIETVCKKQDHIDAVAVTAGPGLMPGLIAGVEAARAIAFHRNIPIIRVNHIAGHIASVLLPEKKDSPTPIQYPALCLIVSGGHTELLLMSEPHAYTLLGATRDDAAGECFDKCAKILGLSYPGGPAIHRLGAQGDAKKITFPRPMIHEKSYDFSFAGLKTAVLYYVRDHGMPPSAHTNAPLLPAALRAHFGMGNTPSTPTITDVCASIEDAIVSVLVEKTCRALHAYTPRTLILSGGVSANTTLRRALTQAVKSMQLPHNIDVRMPPTRYSMDNAAMIGAAGYMQYIYGDTTTWDHITADPNWRLGRSI
jgi:N6-L-threonylcarbamoyladenine synthase